MPSRGKPQKNKSAPKNRVPPWFNTNKNSYPDSLAGFDIKYKSVLKGAEDIDLENARKYRKIVNKKVRGRLTWLPKNQAKWFYKIRGLEQDDKKFQRIFNWYCAYLLKTPGSIPYYRPETLFNRWDRVIGKYLHAQINLKQEQFEVEPTRTAKTIAQRLATKQWPDSVKSKLPQIVQVGIDELSDFRKKLNALQVTLLHTHSNLKDINKLEWAAKIKRNIIALEILLENLPETYNYIEQWYSRVWNFVSRLPDWKGKFGKLRFSVESEEFQNLCNTHCSRWSIIKEMLDED